LEVNAVTPHRSRLGVHDKQQVKLFEAFGQSRQEALAAPSVKRRLVRLAMNTDMVRVSDVVCNRAVQLGYRNFLPTIGYCGSDETSSAHLGR